MVEIKISNFDVFFVDSLPVPEAHSIFVSNLSLDVVHKFDYSYEPTHSFYLAGDVLLEGVPKNTKLLAYSKDTYRLIGECTSSGINGTFFLPVTASGSCFVVCLSDNLSYNHLVATRVPSAPLV